ncbi:hypothetical protein [Flavobacterium selenitireducens]|uniref:hypothetical protein n=1 Tax=Flavobacterium selenitireducens TaxID=2722704 RepID=UPI00168AF17E|nr:hypothetical protein [Flavobacterium selenitireducens]MBD3581571.1 hypothetical protein [Flavobacterium selenitireducens]
MKKTILFGILLLAGNSVFSQITDTIEETKKLPEAQSVSLIRLISNPELFYGKRIKTQGYFGRAFNDDALFLNREDFDNHLYLNAVEINLKKSRYEYNYKENKEFIEITGLFQENKESKNHSLILVKIEYIKIIE